VAAAADSKLLAGLTRMDSPVRTPNLPIVGRTAALSTGQHLDPRLLGGWRCWFSRRCDAGAGCWFSDGMPMLSLRGGALDTSRRGSASYRGRGQYGWQRLRFLLVVRHLFVRVVRETTAGTPLLNQEVFSLYRLGIVGVIVLPVAFTSSTWSAGGFFAERYGFSRRLLGACAEGFGITREQSSLRLIVNVAVLFSSFY